MVLNFGDLCTLLEGAEKISIRRPRLVPDREQEYIQRHVAKWFKEHREDINDPETPGAAILSAIFPHRRKDRVYGLQPPLLSKKIAKLMNFNHGQSTIFGGWKQGLHGDLGRYAELAYKPWDGTFKSHTKRAIPIQRIDNLLTQLAARYRFSDPAIQQQRNWHMSTDTELGYVLKRIESWEVKWFVRLLLREYPTISFDENQVLKQYHFLLPEILKFQNDFDAAVQLLQGDLSHLPSTPASSAEMGLRLEAARLLKPVVGVKVARPTFYKAWSFKHCFQLVGKSEWAAEVKYDGEYCEIHIDVEESPNEIKIFSKNGRDATVDREPLHANIREALRIGQPDCIFKSNCIVLAEMVLYSDKEEKILPFCKIRKHIRRSGSFLGTLQDSLPHEWEHLMLVYFEVLVVDDEPIMRQCLQKRRAVLRNLVRSIPGRSLRSQWTLLSFKDEFGTVDLIQAFARSLAHRQEGLILKPLGVPYFPLYCEADGYRPGYFIKLKKDYLADMGGQRDLGDFAIIGASFDPQLASKTDIKPLHWTHFHIGCVTNKSAVQLSGAKPNFRLVGCLSLDKQISKPDLKYLNQRGRLQEVHLQNAQPIGTFTMEPSSTFTPRMTSAFKTPFVAELLGSGYTKQTNDTIDVLRHPRITKIHHDRTWDDAVSLDDLARIAREEWNPPDPDALTGHARDVGLLVEKYSAELRGGSSQGDASISVEAYATTQETTQETTQRAEASPSPRKMSGQKPAVVEDSLESQSQTSIITTTSPCAMHTTSSLTIELRDSSPLKTALPTLKPPSAIPTSATSTSRRPALDDAIISPPCKRHRSWTKRVSSSPLVSGKSGTVMGKCEVDSQEGVVRVWVVGGVRVEVLGGGEGVGEGEERGGEGG